MKSLHPRLLALVALSLPACGKPHHHPHPHQEVPVSVESTPAKETGKEQPASDHGDKADLGTLALAGNKFKIVQLGDLAAGKESAFEARPQGASAEDLANWNLYLWVEDKAGKQLSAPSKGTVENSALHFHVTPRKGEASPEKVVLRFRSEGTDVRARLPLDGHGHDHPEGPHAGVPASFAGAGGGHLELKLHDDKGDLELWLYSDTTFEKPFDLPVASVIEIEFVDVDGRKVTLRPRNTEKNEDEAGKPNIRDGRTNYFIYPSKADEDASWLKGKTFQSIVIIRFATEGKTWTSEEFVLKPHTH